MRRLRLYARLVRPDQWIKNAFVLSPLIFSRELLDSDPLVTSLRAFLGFCLVSGAVYSINDLSDLEADRAHPDKRRRPLASGELKSWEGLLAAGLLLAGAVAVTLGLGWQYHVILGTYVLLNIVYSLKLKEIVLLDVFLISSGFMLRVLAGAYAISVPVSNWIVLCTMFISLLLGFSKRRGELVAAESGEVQVKRKVYLLYNVDFIDQMLTITAAGAVITYALYTVAPSTLAMFRTEKAIYTTVFVLYGVFRYLYLVHTGKATGNPTRTVTSDPSILVTGFLWILSCVFLIYRH
jgi:4-hydroxybenzoate polyprenyltransferase